MVELLLQLLDDPVHLVHLMGLRLVGAFPTGRLTVAKWGTWGHGAGSVAPGFAMALVSTELLVGRAHDHVRHVVHASGL